MIFGRPTNLWLAVLTIGWNLLVVFSIVTVTAEQTSTVNAFLAAAIGLIANTSNPNAPVVLQGAPATTKS